MIGLDGVNWEVLEHAIEKGLMPNLEDLRREGYTAELETTYPSVTGPAWTSIMTGCNPGRHGVFDFVNHIEEGRPYNSRDIKSETIYEKISKQGEVTVINLPLSYPPKFSGEFVGSFLAPEDDYVRLENLGEGFDFSNYKKSLTAWEKSRSVIRSSLKASRDKKKLLEELLDDQDLFFMLFSGTDWIMHSHYNEMENGENEDAFQIFEVIDNAIGTVRETSENVILLSDHGFKNFDRTFHVNQWLKEEGFLRTEGAMESKWIDNKVIGTAIGAISCSPLRKPVRDIYLALEEYLPLPENVKVRLAGALSEGIDMERSEAFCPSSGIRGIYINDERFRGKVEETDEVREKIIDRLPGEVEFRRCEEVFGGSYEDEGPDILFEEEYARVSRSMYGKVFSDREVNHHGRKGFLVASGKNFSSGGKDSRSIYDIAPTVAELFDLNIGSDGEAIPINGNMDLEDREIPEDF